MRASPPVPLITYSKPILVFRTLPERPFSLNPHANSLLSGQPAELLQLDPGQDSNQRDGSRDEHGPQLDFKNVLVVVRLRGSCDGRKQHQENEVSADTVVLVQLLCILLAAVDLRHKVLREANKSLNENKDVRDQTQDRVGRDEVCAIVGNLVVLDDDEAGDTAREGEVIESSVSPSAVLLLLRCVRGLEDKDALGEEQDCCRVEQL